MRYLYNKNQWQRIFNRQIMVACIAGFLCMPVFAKETIEQQAQSLLDTMSLRQKIGQMTQAEIRHVSPKDVSEYGLGSILNGGGSFPNNKKTASLEEWRALADKFYKASLKKTRGSAGIPLIWGTDAVHGHNNVIGATLFPHNIGLGAANDEELIRKIGAITAKEVLATGIDWAFAPTVAVVEDNRWGRTYEGYSDRPDIVERYAKAMVLGLQGEGDDFLSNNKLVATAKHFIGDGGTYRGVDQGDNRLEEAELLAIHGRGYTAAIEAGIQTVMASFNSWHGKKLHGHKYLLTDVLKQRMGFKGFVISDWNGNGQVEGCNNARCAQAINAGIDMIMVPEDWKAFINNTIAQVKSGEISESRIDDAVRRILEVKLRAGLFDKGLPSNRLGEQPNQYVAHSYHKGIALESVRKSLVLLKNNKNILPLSPKQHVLVAGDGANDIGKQSGGWTISWQGTDNSNSDFPNGTSIYQGIEHAVVKAGGSVELDAVGAYKQKPDVAIVVFGENPYAEGQGDIESLKYQAGGKTDLAILQKLKSQGIPVVAVFLTGRPLWVNAELNASDAFVVAWLPGSEGSGIADVIFTNENGEINYDFTGKLSFDWPAQELNPENTSLAVANHLFDYGYGLSYNDKVLLANDLNEASIVTKVGSNLTVFSGGNKGLWQSFVGDASNWTMPVEGSYTKSAYGEISVTSVDRLVQEDSRKISWTGKGKRQSQFYWQSPKSVDLMPLKDSDGAVSIVLKVDQAPKGNITYRMDCGYPCAGNMDLSPIFKAVPVGKWFRLSIPLSCFAKSGADLSKVSSPLVLITKKQFAVTINEVSLITNAPPASLLTCE